MKTLFSIIATLFIFKISAQTTGKSSASNKFKTHISVLANDSLEGRGTGTPAERKAGSYIKKVMIDYGLQPYAQFPLYENTFTYMASRFAGNKCVFKSISKVRSQVYQLYIDYWPLSASSSGRAFSGIFHAGFGIIAPELKQNDYEGFTALDSGKIFLINIANPDGINPHSHFAKYDLNYRIEEALKHGASAIIFFKNDEKVEVLDSIMSVKIKGSGIPIIYAKNADFTTNRLPKDAAIFIETEIQTTEKTGYNILGALDYQKPYTVVIGAHYDHLGKGDQGGSLHAAHSREIHNGADDNASGVAMMLELIKLISNDSKLHQYNYMFVAFSGEELGLYGSSNLVKQLPVNPLRVNCMINMDMVGRLDPVKKTLAISGTGTSPFWNILDSIKVGDLSIKKSESGVGPSDHTSFYKENIPVLHFFTGMHSDYHKPTDDEPLINYEGMDWVKKYISAVLYKINAADRMPFTKTKDTESTNMPKYKVSLGIMPDYIYDGQGVRADGVTDGKPAQKAGITKGDIIIKIGDFSTPDMGAYTKALGQFSKGDEAVVTIIRDGVEKKVNIVF